MARMTGGAGPATLVKVKVLVLTGEAQFGDVKLVRQDHDHNGTNQQPAGRIVRDSTLSSWCWTIASLLCAYARIRPSQRDDGTNDTPTGFKHFATAAGRVKGVVRCCRFDLSMNTLMA